MVNVVNLGNKFLSAWCLDRESLFIEEKEWDENILIFIVTYYIYIDFK